MASARSSTSMPTMPFQVTPSSFNPPHFLSGGSANEAVKFMLLSRMCNMS